MPTSSFKVGIVGGSISGLTLAHCLDRAGIDYVVLEKHADIAPQVGAGVSVLPNGARIMEQLGLFHRVEALCRPYERVHHCFPDGFYVDSEAPRIVEERFGFVMPFIERRQLLQVLYDGLADKSRIQLRKRVVRISADQARASVVASDGTKYDCDLVVGADGVHSTTRTEMQRIANQHEPRWTESASNGHGAAMAAEFSAVYGVSEAVPGVQDWQPLVRYGHNRAFLVFPARGDSVVWLMMQRMDRRYTDPHIPRFSHDDAVRICESVTDCPIWGDATFGRLWHRRRTFGMSALEEGLLRTWHYGRIVCIGDSVSKMTPNMGQGGNTAMEAAAGLSNGLHALLQGHSSSKPSEHEIRCMLHTFNDAQLRRLADIHEESRFVTRIQAYQGPIMAFFARWFTPYGGDLMAQNIARIVTPAVALGFLPPVGKKWPPLTRRESWGPVSGGRFVRTVGLLLMLVLLACLIYGRVSDAVHHFVLLIASVALVYPALT